MFSYQEYRAFLRHAKVVGDLLLFRDWCGQPGILLRHDVDFDLDPAVKLAELESSEGVVATYFVLLTCPEYNALSREGRDAIRRIVHLGHEVGLHFDPTAGHEKDKESVEKRLYGEASMLSSVTCSNIKSISLHNPSVHGDYSIYNNFINAYDGSLFNNDTYMSDSRRDFSGKDPFDFVMKARDTTVQVLLHPMHYSEDGGGYLPVMKEALERKVWDIENRFRVNSTFCTEIGDSDLFSIIAKRT